MTNKIVYSGLYDNFFAHSTGAMAVDRFIAQAKNL